MLTGLRERLDGRYGFPDGCSAWDGGTWFAYLFNRTALGGGVLLGLWHLSQIPLADPTEGQSLLALLTQTHLGRAFLIFGVFYPTYVWLHYAVDAPGDP